MKRKYQTLIICIILLLILSLQGIQAKSLPLFGIVITIDAGHGGTLYTRRKIIE